MRIICLKICYISVLSLLLQVVDRSWTQEPKSRGPTLGYIDRDRIYCVKEALYPLDASGVLCDYPLDHSVLEPARTDYRVSSSSYDWTPLRWRISHNIFWSAVGGIGWGMDTGRIPLTDLEFFNHADPNREEKYEKRFPNTSLSSSFYNWKHTPAAALWSRMESKHSKDEAYADFFPTSPDSELLFLLRKKRCQVWTSKFTFERKPNMPANQPTRWEDQYPAEPTEVITTSFTEPFIIYVHEESYFFVTMSCKIYIARKGEKGVRKTEPFWSEADQPIDRVITDTTSGQTFAFTLPTKRKDGTIAKPVYFPLGNKLKTKEYDDSSIKPAKVESPMKEIRQAVEVLLQEKEIKIKPSK